MYPNPAREELILNLPNDQPMSIFLYDLQGRQVMAWRNVKGTIHTLQIDPVAKGAYWVTVVVADGRRTKKLIIH